MRKQLRRARAPMLVLLLIPIRAHAAAPLTLDDALEIFRKRGFDLLIADATVDSARADVTIAGALPNPSLAMSRGKSRTYDPSLCNGCSSTSTGAGVTDTGALSDIVSRRRAFRLRVATLALEAARSTRAAVQRTLELNVKQQVLAAELAKRALAFASDAQALTTDTLRLAAARFKAGAVSEVDVARAEAQKLEADQAADIARQNLETATYALAYLLGYAGEQTDLEVAADLL